LQLPARIGSRLRVDVVAFGLMIPAAISSPCGPPAALAEGLALARSYRDTPRFAAVRRALHLHSIL